MYTSLANSPEIAASVVSRRSCRADFSVIGSQTLVTNSEHLRAYRDLSSLGGAMKISRFAFSNKEKTIVKRVLLVIAAAVMFLNTLVLPTMAHADGGAGGTSCGGNSMCKP
jgi:hypothetical protein